MTQHFYGDAEKVINDIYWAETHDPTNKLNIPDTIAERLDAENKAKDPEYYNHRDGVIHVSSLGKCLRGVVHDMLGTEKDVQDSEAVKRKLGVFKAGNLFEDYIVNSLGHLMLDRQTEYVYSLGNGVVLTGRDDGTISYEGNQRMLECKSVHSDSFWNRRREGTLVAYQNQMQIQTYLWLRRILPNVFITRKTTTVSTDISIRAVNDVDEIIYTNFTKQLLWEYRGCRPDDVLIPVEKPDNTNLNGIFAYVSKDDCAIEQAPVRFNQRIISEMVMPALEAVVAEYLAKQPLIAKREQAIQDATDGGGDGADIALVEALDAEIKAMSLPLPPLAIYDKGRGQWKKNWLCTYCEHHTKCAGAGWVLEAGNEVARLNKEQAQSMGSDHLIKKEAPTISVAQPAMVVESNIKPEHIEEMVEAIVETAPTPTHAPIPADETTVERLLRESREKMEGQGILPKSGL